MSTYEKFVAAKLGIVQSAGIDAPLRDYGLFPHQSDLAKWALRRGRAAIFADTGLGKMRMAIAWADAVCSHTARPVIILCPLAVAQQFVAEGLLMGVSVTHCRESGDVLPGINITNYDRMHKFDMSVFGGVALDESSLIKSHASKTLALLMAAFRSTPFKLCCTATPSPNDWTELGTHAEFLGVRSRSEMLAEFFVHDGGDTSVWRLKGHARSVFWRWVASWGAMIRSPADLGYDASAYNLPSLTIHQHTVEIEHNPEHGLFAMEAQTLAERRKARRDSMAQRVKACADMVNADDEPWIVWCDLNDEGDMLANAIPDAVQVAGADKNDTKESRMAGFSDGKHRVLVSKQKICGWGMNWQHCARQAFVGVNDSYEGFYQAVRRSWRFGQKRPVEVHVFASNQDGAVVANIKRKQAAAEEMSCAMSSETLEAVRSEVLGARKDTNNYTPAIGIVMPSFLGAAA
ncbi:MAG: hypothetical protein KBI08_13695 [Sphingobium sp.]|nr:hypothetical protein [Sphingobium sp.]